MAQTYVLDPPWKPMRGVIRGQICCKSGLARSEAMVELSL
jgi:hypothetical protein